MNNVKMTVIIPCYNGWRYMDRCLKSLENQTLLPYEVIIVDDCSTDNSYDYIKSYAETSCLKMKVFKNNKNSGPGESRKKGIHEANGEYVMFCDCDDWYEEEYIELMVEKILTESAEVVICDNYITYKDRKVVCGSVKNLIGANKHRIVALCYESLCRLAIKKKLFEDVYMPAVYNGEDAAVVPQIMAKARNICILDKPLYNYYFRENSASKKPTKEVYLGFLEAFKAVEVIYPEFKDECEFIGIKLIYYAASVNAFKCGISTKIICEFISEFNQKYPNWRKNPYIQCYNRFKKIYVKLLSKKMFMLCRMLASMHHYVTKNKKR